MEYRNHNREESFKNPNIEKRVSIAEIIDFRGGAKGPSTFEYQYDINGQTITMPHGIYSKLSHKSGDELRKYIGNRYYVLYVVEDPAYSKLLIDEPVLDSSLTAPLNGWSLDEY